MSVHSRALAAAALAALTSYGRGAAAQSGGHHLFSPTPTARMRALTPDRPGATESPITLDPGHVQVESDVVACERAVSDGGVQTTWRFATSTLRLGVLPWADVQLVVQPFNARTVTAAGGNRSTVAVGSGDLGLRAKANLVGDDGGPVALAVIAFVTLPTGTAGLGVARVEPGAAATVSLALPAGFSLGTTALVNLASDPVGPYRPVALATLTMGHALVGRLSGFAEVAATNLSPGASPNLEAHGGMVYALDGSVQLDAWGAGVAAGPSSGSLTGFLGVTVRR